MRVLILVSSVLAVASAGWVPVQLNHHHTQIQHIPVIHNGVPIETQEVQHAKQAHFAALAKVIAHPEYENVEEPEYHHEEIHYTVPTSYLAQPISHHQHQTAVSYVYQHITPSHGIVSHQQHQTPVTHVYKYTTPVYETSQVIPAIGHNGKPLDTPEVEAAKAHHFAAVQKALSAVATHGPQIHHHHKRDAHWVVEQHIPVINHHGVPEDTAEVKLARHEHQAAHESAHSGTFGYGIHQAHYPVYGPHGYHIPKFDHKGFQLDTAEVEHAKTSHIAAHQEANSRLVYNNHQASYPVYSTLEYYIPKFDHKGFQLDTAEVEHAKSAHTAAHQEANSRLVTHGYASHWGSGSVSSHHH